VALRTLGDPDDAADALQEAMISAFRQAASFRGESAVTTWLHRIVVNACLDQMRRRAARPAVPVGDKAVLDLLGRQPGSGSGGADPAPDCDTSMDVTAALRMLSVEQRAALVLVDMLGYPVATAAEVLGVSPGTVKSRCARGRARLVPYLAHLRVAPERPGQARNRPASGRVSPSQATSTSLHVAKFTSEGGSPERDRPS
jgi:RNA polymerase sigma-70 factor, ECF subfamily